MIIDNLDRMRIAILPAEANAPLVVDADAVLSHAVTFERFELVARGHFQFFQQPRAMQVQKLAPPRTINGPESQDRLIVEQRFRILAPEGLDHRHRVLRGA